MEKPKYPIGIQTFSEIREENYTYVDKTGFIYTLVSRGKYYFLSRPRRFGKSLLLSTIDALFSGKRELFDGLAIADKEWDWVKYPVFHFDLNGKPYDSPEQLDDLLAEYVRRWENDFGYQNESAPVDERFRTLIIKAYESTGRKVVILVDEYDLPLLNNIETSRSELKEIFREKLQAFYSVLKSFDQYIKFSMLTGVTKFSKLSVFSGLNNLNDISLDVQTNAICGICESELDRDFAVGIAQLAEANDMTVEETREMLRKEFDGYHFAIRGEGIYNPFSLLKTFDKDTFSHYWIESGTPSFLIRILKEKDWDLATIPGSTCTESDIKGADRYLTNPVPILFQSGYLTIKAYDKEFKEYTLDYPNMEVSEGFASELLKDLTSNKNVDTLIKKFVKDVRKGDAESFMATLQSLLTDIPYDQILDKEIHYENMAYLIMKLMGFYVNTEYKTSDGRIDMVVKTDHYIYIMEFKLHGTAEDAIKQIRDKAYAMPFAKEGKHTILIGAAFSDEKRCLDNWIIQPL